MSDTILIDGDLADFLPIVGVTVVIPQPGKLTATGKAQKFAMREAMVRELGASEMHQPIGARALMSRNIVTHGRARPPPLGSITSKSNTR